jgi:hypothetical protein
MNSSFVLIAYYIYLPVVILLTLYVARMLFKNSIVFMSDIFHGKMDIALSTNKLMETGFYLINVGFALLIMEINTIISTQELFEKLATKIGGFAIYLGVMLFFNMYLFFRGRRISKQREREHALENA